MNKSSIVTSLVGYLAIGLLLTNCSNNVENRNNAAKGKYCLDTTFRKTLETTTASKQFVTESIPLTGAVEANPDKVVRFSSLVSGIISNTYFSLGDKVTKGQVLAELRSSQLLELQSQSKTIALQIKVAEKKLQAVQSMFDDGVGSQKDLTEAQSDIAILKAEQEKVNANLNLFSASGEKGVFLLKSPASGFVIEKTIATGQQISAESEPLFTIADLNEVWILVNVYATNVGNINAGMEVDIKTLSYPDEVFKGKIATISQVLDADAKVLKARVVLQNTGMKLKPGMLVDVSARKDLKTEALSIPTAALIFDNNQNYVVVYKSDCELETRPIEILSKSNGTTYLLSGLKENEKIITKNQLLIYEQIKNFNN